MRTILPVVLLLGVMSACSDGGSQPTRVLGKTMEETSTTAVSALPTTPTVVAPGTGKPATTGPLASAAGFGVVRGRAYPSDGGTKTKLSLWRGAALVAETQTDVNGDYAFPKVQPGHYELMIDSTSTSTQPCPTTAPTDTPRDCPIRTSSRNSREIDVAPGEDHIENFA